MTTITVRGTSTTWPAFVAATYTEHRERMRDAVDGGGDPSYTGTLSPRISSMASTAFPPHAAPPR